MTLSSSLEGSLVMQRTSLEVGAWLLSICGHVQKQAFCESHSAEEASSMW